MGPGFFMASQIMTYADANKDGRLEPDEAHRAARRFVKEADPARAGMVNADALGSAINQRLGPPPRGSRGPGGGLDRLAQRIMRYADSNKNGRLTAKEASAAAARSIREADTDQRGALGVESLARAIGGPAPRSEGDGGSRQRRPTDDADGSPRQPGGRSGLPGGSPPNSKTGGPGDTLAAQILKLADTDHDDRVSADEAATAAERLLRDCDTARKGAIDAATLRNALGRRLSLAD
jgi:hypothetical protein